MTEITGNVQAALLDIMIGTMGVLMRMAGEEFGPITEESCIGISAALGKAMADVQAKAEAGDYS